MGHDPNREAADAAPDPAAVPRDADALLVDLHRHLAATQALPVERSASRWIGEAEAVARDLATSALADDVVAERLGHVRDLLEEVDATEHPVADAHVGAAARLAAVWLDDYS